MCVLCTYVYVYVCTHGYIHSYVPMATYVAIMCIKHKTFYVCDFKIDDFNYCHRVGQLRRCNIRTYEQT